MTCESRRCVWIGLQATRICSNYGESGRTDGQSSVGSVTPFPGLMAGWVCACAYWRHEWEARNYTWPPAGTPGKLASNHACKMYTPQTLVQQLQKGG